jgi:hypothetical protein
VIRRIFGPKKDKMTECWRKFVGYSSPDIIRVIKSRIMILPEHVARRGNKKFVPILVGKYKKKRPCGGA